MKRIISSKRRDCERTEYINEHPYVVGRCYLIRTLTFYYTGRLEAVYAGELVVSSCSWIPDSGRFGDFVISGIPTECEPFPDAAQVILSRASIVDIMPWVHDLPRTQK